MRLLGLHLYFCFNPGLKFKDQAVESVTGKSADRLRDHHVNLSRHAAISSLVSSEGIGSLSLVSVFAARFDHLFKLNNDSYNYLLFVRLINAHRVFVMNGDRALFDSCYRLTFLIQKIESQTNNITLELPSQTLDIGNIFNDMKQLIGQSEAGSVKLQDITPVLVCFIRTGEYSIMEKVFKDTTS